MAVLSMQISKGIFRACQPVTIEIQQSGAGNISHTSLTASYLFKDNVSFLPQAPFSWNSASFNWSRETTFMGRAVALITRMAFSASVVLPTFFVNFTPFIALVFVYVVVTVKSVKVFFSRKIAFLSMAVGFFLLNVYSVVLATWLTAEAISAKESKE